MRAAEAVRAPLYVAWQLTNECDLACLHCIEESGPGRAMPGELTAAEALAVLEALAAEQVPYLSFSGGEPLLHPGFFELAARAAGLGMSVKVETNGQAIDGRAAARLAEAGVKAVQVSLDGASRAAYAGLRPRGSFDKAVEALRLLKAAGAATEANFVPCRANVGEAGAAADLAFELGATGFYTGRLIRAGNAAAAWAGLEPSPEEYAAFFAALEAKRRQYEGRMRVCVHEAGISSELKERLASPAAMFIILPNGLVKLVNAMPFVCGDLRRQTPAEAWAACLAGWRAPAVAAFVAEAQARPELLDGLHEWIWL